jgi:hypothetical protein
MKTIKAKVHRLPTEDKSQIGLCKHSERQGIFYGETPTIEDSLINQHLYITTDEEIKEGDLCYDKSAKPGWNGIEGISKCLRTDKNGYWNKNCRKIIATTDPKLNEVNDKNKVDESWFRPFIPKIPQSFIEEYCKSGGIDEVLVEMERMSNKGEWKDVLLPSEWGDHNPTRPKLNPDNTIIIHPVEEKMCSKEEVESLCRNAHLLGMKEALPGYPKPETIDKWIEENL